MVEFDKIASKAMRKSEEVTESGSLLSSIRPWYRNFLSESNTKISGVNEAP